MYRLTVVLALLSCACNAAFGIDDLVGSDASTIGAGGAGPATATAASSGGMGGAGGQAGSGGSGGGMAMCNANGIDTYADDFSDPNLGAWAPYGGGGNVVNGVVEFPFTMGMADAFRGIETVDQYTLLNCAVTVEIVDPHNLGSQTQSYFYAPVDIDNYVLMEVRGDALRARVREGGMTNQLMGGPQFDADAHRYWRISEQGGSVDFATSPDGVSWTSFATLITPPFANDVKIGLGGGTEQAVSNPGTARFDNVNLLP